MTSTFINDGYNEVEVSSPSVSVHTDEANSNDITQAYASTLALGDIILEDILPSQSY